MPVRLVPLSPGLSPHISLERPVLLVGRHPDCDYQLLNGRVSLRHCCLAHVDRDLVIRDLGSTNGVWVNGHRIEESILVNGDEVAIGPLIYRLEDPTPTSRAHAPQDLSLNPILDEDDEDLVPLD